MKRNRQMAAGRIVVLVLGLSLAASACCAEATAMGARTSYPQGVGRAISGLPQSWQCEVLNYIDLNARKPESLHGTFMGLDSEFPIKYSSPETLKLASTEMDAGLRFGLQQRTEAWGKDPERTAKSINEVNLLLSLYMSDKDRAPLNDAAKQALGELPKGMRRAIETSLKRTAKALGLPSDIAEITADIDAHPNGAATSTRQALLKRRYLDFSRDSHRFMRSVEERSYYQEGKYHKSFSASLQGSIEKQRWKIWKGKETSAALLAKAGLESLTAARRNFVRRTYSGDGMMELFGYFRWPVVWSGSYKDRDFRGSYIYKLFEVVKESAAGDQRERLKVSARQASDARENSSYSAWNRFKEFWLGSPDDRIKLAALRKM